MKSSILTMKPSLGFMTLRVELSSIHMMPLIFLIIVEQPIFLTHCMILHLWPHCSHM